MTDKSNIGVALTKCYRQALKAIQGRIKFPDCTQLAEARTALRDYRKGK